VLLVTVACLLAILTVTEQRCLRGCFFGSKNIARTRKEVSTLFEELGRSYQEWACLLGPSCALIHPLLEEQFPTKRKRGKSPNGSLKTKLHLSAALRFYAGGSPLDIMPTMACHDTPYTSIWGITDAINNTTTLSFNSHQAEFPSHVKQEEIAHGFKAQSTAEFDKIF
ncbi:hypothetical protein ACHAW6_002907, partial [Cyclotella cf. meneghiniana]